jgi:3-hydroxyacyl-CoA dehydrogenase/enoyl-CoA hydratase/3-hydroxybutyryl-CoA epimerase
MFTWRLGGWEPGPEFPPAAVPGGEVVHLVADGESAVNALSRESIDELERALAKIAAESGVKALVLSSAKSGHFIAGADIDEIAAIADEGEAARLAARAQEVFGRLERFPVPTFALIHGTCLGGGLELALACHYRSRWTRRARGSASRR